jgi:hemoglobin
MTETAPSLYERLGGYDAVSAVVNNLLPRLMSDEQLGRFWSHRGDDGVEREKQLLIDFLCSGAGGPIYYTGRNMTLTHKGMQISDNDWQRFMGNVHATLDHFDVAEAEKGEVVAFIESTKPVIVEA